MAASSPVRGAAIVALLGALAACEPGVRPHLSVPPPQRLSEWGLFELDGESLRPRPRVLPYAVNAALFSDYADKRRHVWMPADRSASWRTDDVLDLPVGTVLAKTFSYPVPDGAGGARTHRVETRLLVRRPDGWIGLPYVWNEEQSEALLEKAGAVVAVERRIDAERVQRLDYLVPSMVQCKGCHARDGELAPIGVHVRNLDRDDGAASPLEQWRRVGYLDRLPAARPTPLRDWSDPEDGSVAQRARAWLDVNCAHCHRPSGPASGSGLDLRAAQGDPRRLGVCKRPVAAGRGTGDARFAIVPGRPDESILVHRIESTDPGVMMPELGRRLVHAEGVALIRAWIEGLEGSCADAAPRTDVVRLRHRR